MIRSLKESVQIHRLTHIRLDDLFIPKIKEKRDNGIIDIASF